MVIKHGGEKVASSEAKCCSQQKLHGLSCEGHGQYSRYGQPVKLGVLGACKELQRARHDCVLLLELPHLHLAHGLFHPRPHRQAGTE